MPRKRIEARLESGDFSCERIQIREVSGTERISRLFTFDVTLVNLDPDGPGPTDLIGSSVALVFCEGGDLGAEVRRVHGMISRAVDSLETEVEHGAIRIQIVPRAFRLTLVRTQDIYVNASVPDIVMKKLALAGLDGSAVMRLLPGAEKRYPKREFVIQYQESDLDFVSRLLEHVGVSFSFTHGEGGDQIVFTDYNSGFPMGPAGDHAHHSGRGEANDIYRLQVTAEVIPAVYAVSDYNYEKPLVDLSAVVELPDGFGGGIIEYGSNVKDPGESAVLAQVRAEEYLTRSLVFEGEADLCTLSAGTRFKLKGHPRVPDCELLVIECEHRLKSNVFGGGTGDEERYTNVFRAIPVATPYRPARTTPRPRIFGVTHGVVDGEPGATGERPWIDKHGRYIVRVLFDTSGPGERARDSLPIRMAQAHSGRDFGIHFPLRPGTEVLLVFIGGDPDRPVIIASAPNAVTPTPVVDTIATYHRIRTASGVLIEIDDGR
jgi:type VI secretion system secreted protein VgrG